MAVVLVQETPSEIIIRRGRAFLLALVAAISAVPDLGTGQGVLLLIGSLALATVALLPRKSRRWKYGKSTADAVVLVATVCLILTSGGIAWGMSSFWAFLVAAAGGTILDVVEAKKVP